MWRARQSHVVPATFYSRVRHFFHDVGREKVFPVGSYLPDVAPHPPKEGQAKVAPDQGGTVNARVKIRPAFPKDFGQEQQGYEWQRKHQQGVVVKSRCDVQMEQGMDGPLGTASRALQSRERPERAFGKESRDRRVKDKKDDSRRYDP